MLDESSEDASSALRRAARSAARTAGAAAASQYVNPTPSVEHENVEPKSIHNDEFCSKRIDPSESLYIHDCDGEPPATQVTVLIPAP